ncbi:MAG: biotin/lipoyl-binding protein [Syntrophobacterales bacterium]|nr:biotin/lipoyl-binding protein [Syntrophobacterales bacterium]
MRRFHLAIGDKSYEIEIITASRGVARVLVNGRPLEVRYQALGLGGPAPARPVAAPGPAPAPTPPRPEPAPRREAAPRPEPAPLPAGSGAITAPMPGVILEVLVTEGAAVKVGQTVAKLEAMKMENDVKSPVAGVVQEVRVGKGANVTVGEVLMVIAPE